ncbi:S-adenosylmethionine decarboxylase proenzyme 4 [Camellia lanceoleosa]|uniref:S-adenosylmethionine decarboxylase proenzyme 4 n=1 Tax=Camellia lanceoleosa TaxID=1840588 RepID=A0ACC0H8U5_9ERIC|nr:S-adenosylmethionine decarboxylase proenzyme 4 [Camellia lanceoleosa]
MNHHHVLMMLAIILLGCLTPACPPHSLSVSSHFSFSLCTHNPPYIYLPSPHSSLPPPCSPFFNLQSSSQSQSYSYIHFQFYLLPDSLSPMAVSGFEGFEKRLELQFSGDDPAGLGLRQLEFESLEKVLHAVQCTVVSAVGNQYFDSYVLSESSLFVYPTKIIIKTCGTTQLLKSIRPLLNYACDLGLILCGCRYTRGSFIFPNSQPYPHTSFREEVMYLEESLPSHLCYRKATVMPSKLSSHSWHVFTASDDESLTHTCLRSHIPLKSA